MQCAENDYIGDSSMGFEKVWFGFADIPAIAIFTLVTIATLLPLKKYGLQLGSF